MATTEFAVHGADQGAVREPVVSIKHRLASSGAIYRWEFAHRSGAQKGRWFEIAVDGSLTVNDIPLAVRAAEDGIGLTCVLETSARASLDAGRLESVLEPWLPPFDGFYLYYPSRFQVPPKLRVFIDFIREWGARDLASRQRATHSSP